LSARLTRAIACGNTEALPDSIVLTIDESPHKMYGCPTTLRLCPEIIAAPAHELTARTLLLKARRRSASV
jgi:hypothetical protein